MKSIHTSLIRNPKLILTASLLTLTAALNSGCRETTSAGAAEAPPPVERRASVSVADADPVPPPPAIDSPAPEAPPIQDAPPEPPDLSHAPLRRPVDLDLESLNVILENYAAAYDRVPKSIEEMVRLKLIPRSPTPSPGKKFVIDPVKRQVFEVKR